MYINEFLAITQVIDDHAHESGAKLCDGASFFNGVSERRFQIDRTMSFTSSHNYAR